MKEINKYRNCTKRRVLYVQASAQSKMMRTLQGVLTQEELACL